SSSYVWRHTWKKLSALPGPKMVWDQILQPAIRVVADIERTGMPVLRENLMEFAEALDMRKTELQIQMFPYTVKYPGTLSLESTQQMSDFLFRHLKLKPHKLTAKGGKPAVDAESLEALKDKHPFIPLLLEYRKVIKMQGNYGLGMLPHVTEDDRVHCTLNMDGTDTGRFSCSNPNLQTIPSRGSLAKKAKAIFGCKPGRKLVQFDYSQ